MTGKRIINLGSGSYHREIKGNYVQGQEKKAQKPEQKTQQNSASSGDDDIQIINGNYVENLHGDVINGDVFE